LFDVQEILSKFQDYFRKDPNSNIGKLMTIFAEQLQDLELTNQRIREWRDIDKAEGAVLDEIGVELNQPRGVATDEVYRVLLKSKNARNLSTGDINTIIRVLSIALDAEPSEIRIKEQWNDPTNPQPAAISVIELPIKRLNEIGLDPTRFARIVQRTVAAGVKVNTIEMSGTFEFGVLPIETDGNKGFSDIDGTVGGYLGLVYQPNQNQDLPL
jgi:hypothetical protein